MTGRILYGYRMEKGIAVVEQTEGVYVQKLFDDYINWTIVNKVDTKKENKKEKVKF